jgi:hypothetical protein
VAAEVTYVVDHHFDGIANDSEFPWGDYQGETTPENFFDWMNEEATAMHAAGKLTMPYIFSATDSYIGNFNYWLALMQTLTCDYIVLTEGRSPDQAQWMQRISIIANTVNIPIMESVGYGDLGGYIAYWNDLVATYGVPPTLAGFAVYRMPGGVSSNEWVAWDNWILKNISDLPPDIGSGDIIDVISGPDYTSGGWSGLLIGVAKSASGSGALKSVGVKLSTAVGNIRTSIWSTYSAGVFSGLLGQSADTPTVVGWNDPAVVGVSITPIVFYAVFQLSANAFVYFQTSGGEHYVARAYGAFTDPSDACASDAYTPNMRLIYTPTGVPPPLPPAPPVIVTQQTLTTTGTLAGVGIQISPSNIDWGVIVPGASKAVAVQITNRSLVPQTLKMTITAWGLPQAQSLITCSWDRENTTLEPGATITANLTLIAAESTLGDTKFSFNISITGSA